MPKFSSCQLTAIIIISIATILVSCTALFPKEDRGNVFAFASGLSGVGATYLRLPSNKNNEDS